MQRRMGAIPLRSRRLVTTPQPPTECWPGAQRDFIPVQSQLRESVALPSERRVDRNRAMTALAARAGAARRAGRVEPLRERR